MKNKKLRILMIAACPFPGNRGTPSRILKMSEALQRKGNEVTVLTYNNRDFNLKKTKLKIIRIPKIPFYNDNSPGPKLLKPLADILLLIKGVKLLYKNNFDIIHGHHLEGGLCGLVLQNLYNIPSIYDSHIILDNELKSFKKYNFLPIYWVLSVIENICYKYSSGVVYVDKEIKNHFERKNFNPLNSLVLPTGTNIKELNQSIKHNNPLKKYSKSINIIYTGSISKYQNIEDILEVANRFKDKDINFFIVTGQSSFEGGYLLEKVKEYNLKDKFFILFNKGFLEQINYAYYSDIVLSPRHSLGGIPQKITNYMALGKKIVLSDGSAKVLTNKEAYIYKSGDIQDFYNQLILAINDKTGIKEKEAKKLVQIYDWDNLIKDLIKFYNKIKNGQR